MDKELSKQSNLMKMEAMALFTALKAQTRAHRWWYFEEMHRMGRTVRLDQTISAYRASFMWDYVFCGIDCQMYLEREAHVGQLGEDMWTLSFSGIEGKVKALRIQEELKTLQQEGFYIPNGNENLERQMNFSLGLYGACLMHVDVRFPIDRPPLPCALQVLDLVDAQNKKGTSSLEEVLVELDRQRALNLSLQDDEDPDIMMGDWQTWK